MEIEKFALGENFDQCAGLHEIEEPYNVFISHADASVAGRSPDQILLIGAMDVDVAILGIGIFRLQTFEPENAGSDQITLTRPVQLAISRFPADKDRIDRLILADFFRDPKSANRCLPAAHFGSQAEPRR